VRIGIIGCGLIGNKRAAAASGHTVVSVSDIDPKRAESLAKKTNATVEKNWQGVVERNLDIVIVATTHDVLAPISLAAIEAGKHVLVEKPAGRSSAEVASIVDAAIKNERFVKCGFNHRFHPAIQKAYEISSSGELGPLMFIRGRYGHGGRVGYEKEWRCQPEISGGGELIDQGSHLIDLSRWFLGDLKLDYGFAPTMYWDIPTDDNCFLSLKSDKGQIAWLHASWSEWKNMFSFEIYGRDGKLSIEGLGGSYGLEKLTHYQMLPQMGPPKTTTWEFPFPDNSWDLEFKEFINAIENKREPVGNIKDALANLQIVDQVYGRNQL